MCVGWYKSLGDAFGGGQGIFKGVIGVPNDIANY
jgi:hypothetical protein